MLSTLEHITTRLDVNGLEYAVNANDGVITADVVTDLASFRLHIATDEEDGIFQVRSSFCTRIPQLRRASIALFCCLANAPLNVGRLDFQVEEGRVRVSVSVLYEPGNLPGKVIVDAIERCIDLSDLFHPAIMSIAFGGQDSLTAWEDLRQNLKQGESS